MIFGITTGFSQGPEVKMNNVSAGAGAVVVPVEMNNFTAAVGTISMRLTFDPALLTFTGLANINPGFSVPGSTGLTGTMVGANTILISYMDMSIPCVYQPSGHAFDLKFNYTGAESTPLQWQGSLCNISYGITPVNVTYINGTITSLAPPLSPVVKVSDVVAAPGAVLVPVKMMNFTQDINSFEYNITFDNTLLAFVSIEHKVAGLSSGFVSNVVGNTIHIQWSSVAGFTPASGVPVFDLKFDYVGGFCSNLDFAPGHSVTYGTVPVENVAFVLGSVCPAPCVGTASLGTLTAATNTAVTVPLHLNGAGFSDVMAFQFKVSYDVTKLTYVPGLISPVVPGIQVTNPSSGILLLTWFGTTAQNWTNTDILGLKFNYIGVSSADLCFEPGSYVINQGATNISTCYTCGQVNPVPSPAKLDIADVTSFSGQNVSLPIVATDLGTVDGIELHISYDATKLTYINYTKQQLTSIGSWLPVGVAGNVLTFIWTGFGNSAPVLNGDLITLQFLNNGCGCAPVEFVSGSFVTKPIATQINVNFLPGSVCPATSSQQAIISHVTQCAGGFALVPVSLSGVGAINTIQFNIGYLSAGLDFIGLVDINPALTGLSVSSPLSNPIVVSWFSTTPVNANGVLFKLKFNYKGDSPVTFNCGSSLGNAIPETLPIQFIDGMVDCNLDPPLCVGTASADQEICAGTAPQAICATAPCNGTSSSYQWQSSLDNTTWTNISGATGILGPANGNNAGYQWQSNIDNASFSNVSGATASCYQPGVLTVTTYFRQMQDATGTSGGPLPTNVVTITVDPILAVGTISASQTLCGGQIPAPICSTGPMNGTNPTYQWQSSLDNITFTNVDGATTCYQPGAFTGTIYYRQMQNASGTCGGPMATNVVSITLSPNLVPGMLSADQAICPGELPAPLCATPPNGTNPRYIWQSSLDNTTFTNIDGSTSTACYQPGALNATTYFRQLQYADGTCGGWQPTNVVTITFNPALIVGTLSANQGICIGETPALLCATAPNGTNATYTWQSSLDNTTFTNIAGSTSTACYQPGALTATTYFRQMQNSDGTCGGPLSTNVVTISVNPPLVVGTLSASQSICAGSLPSILCATPPNGTNPRYQWQSSLDNVTFTNVDGATSTACYQPGILTATTYFRQLQYADGTCGGWLPTNVVTIAFSPTLSVGTISASQTICAGQTPAQLCGTGPNNGTNGTYQWQSSLDNVTFANVAGATSCYQPGPLTTTTYYRQMQNADGTCGGPLPTNVVVITVNPMTAPTISGAAIACINSTGNVYTTETGMTGYIWTVTGGTITAGGTSTSNTVTITWTTVGAQTVCVNYTNASGCTALAPVCKTVTVSAIPVPTIAGRSAICKGSSANYTTQAGGSGYQWQVTGGVINTPIPWGNVINVTWNTVGPQTISVVYTNASGCAAVAPGSLTVTVNPIPAPTIGSTNIPCVGSTAVYYTELGMTGYTWSVSSGGQILSGQGTATVTVQWNVAGAQSVTVTYSNAFTCSGTFVYNLFVGSAPTATGTISGPASVCLGTNGVVYITTPITGAVSYIWTVPAGATIMSGQGTATITVDFGTSALSGNITVAGSNECGTGPVSTYAITLNTVPTAPVAHVVGNVVNATPVIAGAVYTWYYEGNPTTPVFVGNPFTVTNNTGYYWCTVTVNGCTSLISNKVWVIIVGTPELPASSSFTIYPVPNNGQFTASIRYPVEDTFTIAVYNMLGAKLFEMRDVKTVDGKFDTKIDLRSVSNGMYTVVFMNSEYKVVKKVLINK